MLKNVMLKVVSGILSIALFMGCLAPITAYASEENNAKPWIIKEEPSQLAQFLKSKLGTERWNRYTSNPVARFVLSQTNKTTYADKEINDLINNTQQSVIPLVAAAPLIAQAVVDAAIVTYGIVKTVNEIQEAKAEKKKEEESSKPKNLAPEGSGRRGAFRQAKRDANIPVTRHPDEVKPAKDRDGNKIEGKDYTFKKQVNNVGNEISEKKIIRDHKGGHQYQDDPSQNRGPHINGPKNNSHYDYMVKRN